MDTKFLLINSSGSVYKFLKKCSSNYGILERLVLNGVYPEEESLQAINKRIAYVNPEIIFIESRIRDKSKIHDVFNILQADPIYKDIKIVYIGDSDTLPQSYLKFCYSLNLPFTNDNVIKLISTIRNDKKFKIINDFYRHLDAKIINKSISVENKKLKI